MWIHLTGLDDSSCPLSLRTLLCETDLCFRKILTPINSCVNLNCVMTANPIKSCLRWNMESFLNVLLPVFRESNWVLFQHFSSPSVWYNQWNWTSYPFPGYLLVKLFLNVNLVFKFFLTFSSYLRITLDDGKQCLMHSNEHSLVALWGQVVEWHRLQRSKDQNHMMGIGNKPLPLPQQWCHRRDSRNSER